MTQKKSNSEIKIGSLIKFKPSKHTSLKQWKTFAGFIGLVVCVEHYHIHFAPFTAYKILWCSSRLRKYDDNPMWTKEFLEVIK